MEISAGRSTALLAARRIGIAVGTAAVVIVGARGAFLLSQNMMNAIALVGSWVMLVLVVGYIVARFRPSAGIPMLVGFGVGAVVVAAFAGMGMMT
ncbi:hypothetical protein CLV71_1052 [Actinophytocola oryzae]|uniref:Uncharacterized protein n=2 Tax=Actinophytocola oryzae TaxID=502181 RepID=A0A4R7VQ54_9PSEU|nr:hypothetical protein CLV71_1052 [Actinophytocola oryzae]